MFKRKDKKTPVEKLIDKYKCQGSLHTWDVSLLQRHSKKPYQWKNTQGQTVEATRKIANTIEHIETRLRNAFCQANAGIQIDAHSQKKVTDIINEAEIELMTMIPKVKVIEGSFYKRPEPPKPKTC